MKYLKFLIVLAILLPTINWAQEKEGFEGRPITENIWMQTGNTLNEGEFNVGIGPLAYGFTNQVQIETNILYYLVQVYNAKVKVNVMRSEEMALAAGVDFNHYDLTNTNDDQDVALNTFGPYVAFSNQISEKTTVHLSAKFTFFNVDIEEFEASGTSSGSEIMAGLDYNVSHKTKLLVETGYDATFKGPRFGGGVLFGWESFRLKLGVSYFNPENTDGFTLPVIGLWWRFKG